MLVVAVSKPEEHRLAYQEIDLAIAPGRPEDMQRHFADAYDKLLRATESLDLLRDLVAGVRDYAQATIAIDENEVMKRLTAIAAPSASTGRTFATSPSCAGISASVLVGRDRSRSRWRSSSRSAAAVGSSPPGRSYPGRVAFFICPNCKNRSIDADGRQGITHQPVACARCGFGFLFELMEDYYPAPSAGLVACDKAGRILAAGRGVFELTGFRETELMGKDVVDALGLSGFDAAQNPAAIALEWGVRRLGERLTLRSRAGRDKPVVADFFPGYDRDGGLLVALAPG